MISFITRRLERILHALQYSLQGLGIALKQKPFQEELALCIVLIPCALWLDVGLTKKLLLVGSLLGVLVAEIFNTAVEAAIDRIGLEKHVFSGMAKDLGSAGVLLCIIWAIIVWVCILWTM